MGEALRIGVSGIGSIGRRRARLLASLGVGAVCLYDAAPGDLEVPAELAPVASWASSFEDLLDRDLDGLVVAAPDEFHGDQVAAACTRGVAVLVEKPLACSAADGRRTRQVAADTGTPVLVGYVLRYSAPMLLARELLAGTVGHVVSVHATLGAYETLQVARNRFAVPARYRILLDYSHEWDYLRWLVGPVRRVAATAHTSGDRPLVEDPNVVDGLLEFEGGGTGTFHLDYVQGEGSRACTFIGDRGVLHLDARRGRVEVRTGDQGSSRTYDRDEPRDAMFLRQLEHFLAVVRGTEIPRVTVDDGIYALEVAESVKAASERHAWVDLAR